MTKQDHAKEKRAVTELTINQKYMVLRSGSQPVNLQAILKSENATNQNIFLSTDNPEVATEGPTGRVTPRQSGGVTITAQKENDNYNDTSNVIVLTPLK